jgi:hypothetical protein
VLGGIDVAGAEQNGECGHRQRNEQRQIPEWRLRYCTRRRFGKDGRHR